jgi:hypothetical protein
MIRRGWAGAVAGLVLAAAPAFSALAAGVETSPPGGAYRKFSDLAAVPDFMPGLGTLYVDPRNLPQGPFLAYDHRGRLVSTVYMIPLKSFETHMPVAGLAGAGGAVDHVDIYYENGHPGAEEPHYHIVLWHVTKAEEARVAR